jgi:hypothetical protein
MIANKGGRRFYSGRMTNACGGAGRESGWKPLLLWPEDERLRRGGTGKRLEAASTLAGRRTLAAGRESGWKPLLLWPDDERLMGRTPLEAAGRDGKAAGSRFYSGRMTNALCSQALLFFQVGEGIFVHFES